MNFSMMQSLLPLLGCLVILLNEYVLVHVRHVDTLAVFPFFSSFGSQSKEMFIFFTKSENLKSTCISSIFSEFV